jgi:hypothetical protein
VPDNFELPIQRVLAREGDRTVRAGGGGGDVVFEEGATAEDLLGDLERVEPQVNALFVRFPHVPAVLSVTLKERALAKSHRPTALFDDEAPVIGVGKLGELLVASVPHSVAIMRRRISNPGSKKLRANISAIEDIALVQPESKIGILPERDEFGQYVLKVKLFDYHDQGVNDESLGSFISYLHDLGIDDPTVYQYAPDLRVFGLGLNDLAQTAQVAEFPSVRSASAFPRFNQRIEFASVTIGDLSAERFPVPEAQQEYPTVAVFDSGTDPRNTRITPWLVDRYEHFTGVPRDFAHGTFVSALVANCKSLNGMRPEFPSTASKILDIVAMPASGGLNEPDLIAIVDAALAAYPDVRVWNFSLGYPDPADTDDFSDLARAFDARQDRHDALFVIAAGNYTTRPLRTWPPTVSLRGADRVSAPGDSARGLTVASVAHLQNGISAVQTGEPSPFSRCGPGPSFIPKPEVHHHGGNCSTGGDFTQIGVQSMSSVGHLAEDIGTSYATPIVSSILANVDRALGGAASRNVLKALAVHSALLGAPGNVSASELNYYGFGKPGDVVDILACDPWSFTFLFEPELVSGYYYSIWPFPLPACLLRDNRLYGEVLITLVYNPPLDKNYGFEYCRSNVEVSFGTYLLGEDGQRHQAGKVPPEPSTADEAIETHLIKHGFKWSPTKVYRKRFAGTRGDVWRLSAEVFHRSNFAPTDPQNATILLTLRDPEKRLPVYTDTISALRLSGRPVSAVRVRDQLRYRRRT